MQATDFTQLFLIGPRATGKSSLLKQFFADDRSVLWVNLLNSETYRQLLSRPEILREWIAAASPELKWVVCDEIQKVPGLLDLIHDVIEEKKIFFALTGLGSGWIPLHLRGPGIRTEM